MHPLRQLKTNVTLRVSLNCIYLLFPIVKPIDLKQRKAELEAELAKLIAGKGETKGNNELYLTVALEIELVTMSQVTQPGEGEGIGV